MTRIKICYQVVDRSQRSPLFERLEELYAHLLGTGRSKGYRLDAVVLEYELTEVNHWAVRTDPRASR
jgi:hypothetical protein